jgi:acetylornithine/N-succinyldiaminopimelate aminotransferase
MRDAFFKHIAQTSDSPIAIEVDYAEGIYIYSSDGLKYTDFISGIAVSSLGHSHPNVVQAVQNQAAKHMHVMVYGEFIQKPQSDLAQLLATQLPVELQRIYFVNSGTEAIEGALKLAKKHTGRSKMVAFRNSYHGDSHGSLSVTGRDVYRDPYLPLLPDVHFLEFNRYEDLEIIDNLTACVIIEPIQGEGGVIEADFEWLQALKTQCQAMGALLIFDEIQSGFGRTGKLFTFMHSGVQPDILCMAKAMGGGMPIGAFASSDNIFETFKYNPPLNHVTTFGGHPVSCAASYATLKTILDENLMDNAIKIEETIKSRLNLPQVVEIRGRGAMLGLQLHSYQQTMEIVEKCLKRQILLGWTLHSNTLVRLAPPLIISEKELNDTLNILVDVISEVPTYNQTI